MSLEPYNIDHLRKCRLLHRGIEILTHRENYEKFRKEARRRDRIEVSRIRSKINRRSPSLSKLPPYADYLITKYFEYYSTQRATMQELHDFQYILFHVSEDIQQELNEALIKKFNITLQDFKLKEQEQRIFTRYEGKQFTFVRRFLKERGIYPILDLKEMRPYFTKLKEKFKRENQYIVLA